MSERDAVELLLKQTEDLLVRTRRQIDALAASEPDPRAIDAGLRDRCDETFDGDVKPHARF